MPDEARHRLALECYGGEVAVAFAACLRLGGTARLDDESADVLIAKLVAAAEKFGAAIPAWCLMPDHLHVILFGRSASAHGWNAMAAFKQQSGIWLVGNRPAVAWQKDFYDHIIRSHESLEVHARYIAGNPVRAGLVAHWRDYPCTGGTLVELLRAADG